MRFVGVVVRWAWIIVRWAGSAVLLVALFGALYLGAVESYFYITRTEAKGRAAAQVQFVKLCDEYKLDPNSFRGPDLVKNAADQYYSYSFVWTRSPQEEIFVSVVYLPYDLLSSVTEAIPAPRYEPRIKR
jgi:hypothetical protein